MNEVLRFKNISKILSVNKDLQEKFYAAYRWNEPYLEYLDGILRTLTNARIKGLKEKITDVDDLQKFDSLISELEIAEALCKSGKRVELLSDSYMGGEKSPDMRVIGQPRDALVEVKMISDEEVEGHILDRMREFLKRTNYVVSLSLTSEISQPNSDLRRQAADRMLDEFEKTFKKSIPEPTSKIETKYGSFHLGKLKTGEAGFPAMIRGATISVPSQEYETKIAKSVLDKTKKRLEWDDQHKKYLYIVALVCRQAWIDEDDLRSALIGKPTAFYPGVPLPKVEPTPTMNGAAKSGWASFLRKECGSESDRVILLPENRGIFFTDNLCSNVSAVIARFKNWSTVVVPNPFASREINDKRLGKYLSN